MSMSSQEKIECYRGLLQKPFWEIEEAGFFLSGICRIDGWFLLDEEVAAMIGMEKFGFVGGFESESEAAICQVHVQKIVQAIHANQRIKVISAKLSWISRERYKKYPFLKGHTYLLCPNDVLAIAVAEGIKLPKELQIASGLYQLEVMHVPSASEEKEAQREAVAQVFCFRFPGESISGLCRKMIGLKNYNTKGSHFDFLYDSEMRARRIVKRVKTTTSGIPFILDIFAEINGVVVFDFWRLKIIVNMVATLLLGKEVSSSADLLNHPLVRIYTEAGGTAVKNFIYFYLQPLIEDFECSCYLSQL